MKKTLSILALFILSFPVLAGGLLTNTNQHAAFLRNPARDAVIDIDAVYSNPAGLNFLKPGFYGAATLQTAQQDRDVTTTFPTLALNQDYLGQSTRKYHGHAIAAVVPSVQFAYVGKNWNVNASFAIAASGGKCTFEDGIGSFELAYYDMITKLYPTRAGQTYKVDSYLKGFQYYYGVQVGGGYRFNDKWSLAGGLRLLIGDGYYDGYLKSELLTEAKKEITLHNDQSGLGLTPYLSLNFRPNKHWNLAGKYEFKTRVRLKNKSEMSDAAKMVSALDKYNEEKTPEFADDVPGILTLGAQYEWHPGAEMANFRLSGGFHFYDDCNATKYGDAQKAIDKGTLEFLAGAEYDAVKWLTISAGWQCTRYRLSDAYMNEMSYNLSSNMIAVGVRVKPTKHIGIDLGYMHNFYHRRDVETQVSGYTRNDHYYRTNDVVALGVNFTY